MTGVLLLSVALVPAPAEMIEKDGSFIASTNRPLIEQAVERKMDGLPPEGYWLSVAAEGIRYAAADAAGRFYASQTLEQLSEKRGNGLAVGCVEIRDYPRFRWRGVMLDESRHFFGKTAVKEILDAMAFHKLNVFHWHLTDNQGWRLPVAKHPELTGKASVRYHMYDNDGSIYDRPLAKQYGPFFYTEEEIREIVAYAAARQIRIVPEVDLPGHSTAVLDVHPELRCGPSEVFCFGNPATLDFFREVFESVVALFPDAFVHIGCDEVNKKGWEKCPKCQALMKREGLPDVNALQAWIVGWAAKELKKHGRRIIGWDEIAFEGEMPEGAVAMEWRDGKFGGAEAVKKGHECIMTPWKFSYFICSQGLEDDPIHYQFKDYSPVTTLETAYSYDPMNRIPPERQKLVLGGQCCNWGEMTVNETVLQWKMWPRTCATAEIYWSPASKRDFADFHRRLTVHRPRLLRRKINCAPLPPAPKH